MALPVSQECVGKVTIISSPSWASPMTRKLSWISSDRLRRSSDVHRRKSRRNLRSRHRACRRPIESNNLGQRAGQLLCVAATHWRLSGYQQPSLNFKMARANQKIPASAVGLAAWAQLGLAAQGRLVWRPAQGFAAKPARAGVRAQLASAGPLRNSNQAKCGCPRCRRSAKQHTSHRHVSQHGP